MYHAISDEQETAVHPYFRTAVSSERFARHMGLLAENGYNVVPLSHMRQPDLLKNLTRPCVAITFDDGFTEVATIASPLLNKFGFPATVFLPAAFIGSNKTLVRGRTHMNWDDARRIIDVGITLGSHTVNHRDLGSLSSEELVREIGESKQIIEKETGPPVTEFACPFAFPQEDTIRVREIKETLNSAGYQIGVTTKIGVASAIDDPFTLPRLPINNEDDDRLFLAKINGAYNWLAPVQTIVRQTKRLMRRASSDG
jgi:peptidoglycan/xylan/chitin deacetylase (PgdA/CDA1 family)